MLSAADVLALSEELTHVSRALPDEVSKQTCTNIDRAAAYLCLLQAQVEFLQRELTSKTVLLKSTQASLDKFQKLDREAAAYVETQLVSLPQFTGEEPYVGWKGLGLVLSELIAENKRLKQDTCRKCGGAMKPGTALAQTFKKGAPDFPDGEVSTLSAGGPGEQVSCMKCEACGWSVNNG